MDIGSHTDLSLSIATGRKTTKRFSAPTSSASTTRPAPFSPISANARLAQSSTFRASAASWATPVQAFVSSEYTLDRCQLTRLIADNSTKYAVEGITAALSKEVAHLGITALVVEPGYFRTNFMTSSPESTGAEIEDYKVITGPSAERRKAAHGKQPGDPVKGANVIIDVVLGVGVAEGRKAPAQFPLGPDAVAVMQNVVDAQQKIINDWKDISSTTNFD